MNEQRKRPARPPPDAVFLRARARDYGFTCVRLDARTRGRKSKL